MPFASWFRRDPARNAGQKTTSRVFTLGGLLTMTVVLAAGTAVVALPLRDAREDHLNGAVRAEVAELTRAIEEYRATTYRFPDHIRDLKAVGYTVPPAIDVCRFRHDADARNFDDHVELALRHRGSETALALRYPSRATAVELQAAEACTGGPDAAGGQDG